MLVVVWILFVRDLDMVGFRLFLVLVYVHSHVVTSVILFRFIPLALFLFYLFFFLISLARYIVWRYNTMINIPI